MSAKNVTIRVDNMRKVLLSEELLVYLGKKNIQRISQKFDVNLAGLEKQAKTSMPVLSPLRTPEDIQDARDYYVLRFMYSDDQNAVPLDIAKGEAYETGVRVSEAVDNSRPRLCSCAYHTYSYDTPNVVSSIDLPFLVNDLHFASIWIDTSVLLSNTYGTYEWRDSNIPSVLLEMLAWEHLKCRRSTKQEE